MRIFVLLFNARTENEGIHTLRMGNRNLVLMFEEEDDATRFGVLLEAQDFPPVAVEAFESEEIEEFCKGAGYEAKIISKDELLMPPEANVEDMDWDPDAADRPQATDDATAQEAAPTAQEMSSKELDRIRRQLENLL